MWKSILQFSLKKVINTVVRHLLDSQSVDSGGIIGIFAFLWFFYIAVADRIFPTADTVLASSAGIVNPLVYTITFDNNNWLVFLFLLKGIERTKNRTAIPYCERYGLTCAKWKGGRC